MAHPTGIIYILEHIPIVDISSKLKLLKHIPTPISSGKYQVVIDDRTDPKYLTINQDATSYAMLHDLDQCTHMRDTYTSNDVSILKKLDKRVGV